MKTFTNFLFLLAFCLAAYGQTNVSGFISANTTWTLAGSPYIVIGNALVSNGYTLTIEPGVVIKFNTDKALQIDGELIAIGTPTNRITFTSNQTSPAPGDWAKIHFPDICVDAVFDGSDNYISGSIMKYCDILYGGGLGFGEIHIEVSSPYFNHCNILHSESAGIYAHITSSWIDSSTIKNCHDYGLHVTNIPLDSSDVYLRYNTIENNNGGGINLGPSGGANHLILFNNYFTLNQGNGALVFSQTGHFNVIIEENTFFSNSGTFVVVGDYLNNNSINCNKFINNSGKTLYLTGGYYYEGTITNNLFEGNSSPENIITIRNHSAYSPTYFYNNTVRNNNSAESCFKMDVDINNNQFTHIRNNDFTNNIAQNTILIDPVQPPSGSYDFLYMKHNNFSNPLTQYEIYNDIPYGSANVYIDSNYWGGNSTQHVDSVIYDYFDFANQSVVYYQPLLERAIVIDTTCPAFVLPTAIKEIDEQQKKVEVMIYPNPFSNQFTAKLFDNEQITISLYDFIGQQILQQTFTYSTTLNTEQLAGGIYFYELRNSNGTIKTGKVIKQ